MSQDDKAYELIRSWRRGEINGNQFDFRLNFLGLSESHCLSIAKRRDSENMTMIIKEVIIMVIIIQILHFGI
jgi:hypothetical protein